MALRIGITNRHYESVLRIGITKWHEETILRNCKNCNYASLVITAWSFSGSQRELLQEIEIQLSVFIKIAASLHFTTHSLPSLSPCINSHVMDEAMKYLEIDANSAGHKHFTIQDQPMLIGKKREK